MTRTMVRLGLSLIVALGCWTKPLPAQPPAGPAPAACAGCAAKATDAARRPGLRQLFNARGVGCQADPDGACGSLHQELRFVFGSCRTFFNEPCVPNPPHPARRAP